MINQIDVIITTDYYGPGTLNISFDPPEQYWKYKSEAVKQELYDKIYQAQIAMLGEIISNRYIWSLKVMILDILNRYQHTESIWIDYSWQVQQNIKAETELRCEKFRLENNIKWLKDRIKADQFELKKQIKQLENIKKEQV